jgi:hypothetical protein
MLLRLALVIAATLALAPAAAAQPPPPPSADDVFAEPPADGHTADVPPAEAAADETCPDGLECHRGRDGVMRSYRRTETHRQQTDLMIIGGVMLGGAWLLNIGASIPGSILLSEDTTSGTRGGDYLGWSFVPLVGPVAQMFQVGDEHWAILILAAVEATEIVGVVVAALGTLGEDVVVLEPVAGVSVVPWASGDGGGLTAFGAF